MEALPRGTEHRVARRLDKLLAERGMTLTELAGRAGITVANPRSVLKNKRARAIRFSILTLLCDALGCQPGAPARSRATQRRRLNALNQQQLIASRG